MEANRPKTGVGVMIFKDGKILLGARKNAHGEGSYSFPGGHAEGGESWEETAKREVLEETGITIKNVRFQFVSNETYYAPKYYTHIGMVADWESGDPQVMEPDKCDGWAWYSLDALPKPLMAMVITTLEAYKTGKAGVDRDEVNRIQSTER